MKTHIVADAVRIGAHRVRYIRACQSYLRRKHPAAWVGDSLLSAGYQRIVKRPDAKTEVAWHEAMRPGKRKALNKEN